MTLLSMYSISARLGYFNSLARAYTGYIDIEARHLFFSFFESRSEPHKDDVILWIHGGKILMKTALFILMLCYQAQGVHLL